ncbi:MAG: glycosyltransferase family 4 protein [Herpetosiphonaceae bacterium]|nr:glycosyltransferase family 4 protein [Herpetosiphonaceae bacterium]
MHLTINGHLLSFDRSFRQAGVSNHTRHLIFELAKLDRHNRYTLFVGPGVRQHLDLPENWQVLESRLPTIKPKYRIPWEQFVAPLLLARQRATLFHGLLNISPLLSPVPTIVTIHDLAFMDVTGSHRKANRRYLAAATRQGVRQAAHIFAVSEYSKQAIVERLGIDPARISIAYNAAGEQYRPRPAAKLAAWRRDKGVPEQFMLYLGTLEPRKNIPNLLRAYAKVRAEVQMPLLIGGGKGWHFEEIFATHAELGLGDSVQFLGYVPGEDLPLWYNAATFFVYPSRYEGFGIPPLEAMASGTPVLTTNATSIPEVVGAAAIQVDPDDVDGMAEQLRRMARDPALRADLRERGLRRAADFSWATLAQNTLEVYRQVAGSGAV